ncbi:hypothetical protein QW131_06080 [Roseibium salinum]|nr:hypothetical protein [Roseibium salinum]
MIALILVLNALSGDSELIVIDASGGSRFLVLRPVMIFLRWSCCSQPACRSISPPHGACPAQNRDYTGAGRPRRQHRQAGPFHHRGRRPDVPHPQPVGQRHPGRPSAA